jgi:TRAP-type C4-dicarboxylate transport system permease small subunit
MIALILYFITVIIVIIVIIIVTLIIWFSFDSVISTIRNGTPFSDIPEPALWVVGAVVFAMILALAALIRGAIAFDREVQKHKENLKKGGLVQRVPKHIHEKALSELGHEKPNSKLPRSKFYD